MLRQFDFSFSGTIATATNYVTSAGTTLIGKAPAAGKGGGMSVIEAWAEFKGGTAPFVLIELDSAGTGVMGTIGTISGAYTAAAPKQSFDPAGYFVDAGNFIGMVMAAGTIQYPGGVHVLCSQGRGAA